MSFAARSAIATSASSGYTTIYNGTVTVGTYLPGGGISYRGYSSTMSFGSTSPTTVTTGYGVVDIYDYRDTGGPSYICALTLNGFGATDPGQSYIYSITVNGVTKLASVATIYVFFSGSAYWEWESVTTGGLWGIPTSGTVSAVILK